MRQRPRRNRKSFAIREMVAETNLKIEDLIYPLFLFDGKNQKKAIDSMPNCFRWTLDLMLKEFENCGNLGEVNESGWRMTRCESCKGKASWESDDVQGV